MIYPKYSPFFTRLFSLFVGLLIRLHFREIRIIGQVEPDERPVLFIANHISWWDGFIALKVNEKIFRKKMFVMMLGKQLKHLPLFRYSGAFSIDPGTRNVVESLAFARDLLEQKENMVVMYPQGELRSMQHRDFVFKKGIEHIVRDNESRINIVFAAVMADYFAFSKPSVYVYLVEFHPKGKTNTSEMEAAYRDFFSSCLHQHDIAV